MALRTVRISSYKVSGQCLFLRLIFLQCTKKIDPQCQVLYFIFLLEINFWRFRVCFFTKWMLMCSTHVSRLPGVAIDPLTHSAGKGKKACREEVPCHDHWAQWAHTAGCYGPCHDHWAQWAHTVGCYGIDDVCCRCRLCF